MTKLDQIFWIIGFIIALVISIATVVIAVYLIIRVIILVVQYIAHRGKHTCDNCMYGSFGRNFHPCRDCSHKYTDYWRKRR